MGIIDISLKRPVSVIICTIATFVFGCYSYMQMGMQNRPDMDLPRVTVTTTMAGASASILDNNVTDVIEENLSGISGINSINSSSYQGRAVTVIEFDMSKELNAAAAEVRDKVSAAQVDLPDEADTPVVEKFDTGSSAIMQIAVTGTASYKEKAEYVDKVMKVKLQAVNQVGSIDTSGYRAREIRIWLDPATLNARGLVADDIATAINNKHVELPAGSIFLGRNDMDLNINGEYTTADELKNLSVVTKNGATIRLGDISKIEDGFAEKSNIALLNNDDTIIVSVKKQSGANEVQLCDGVSSYLENLQKTMPAGIEAKIIYNQADYIKSSIAGVRSDVMVAVLLCSVLMFLFLQTFRATFVAVITIPVCLVGSFIIMEKMGITINNISMMGISLSVGMVVDATTVVLENVSRHIENGMSPMEAAEIGTKEIAFSVVGGALTTVAVFSPIAFMGGIIGRIFYAFGATVILTISLSLLISMTLAPFLCSRLLKKVALGKFGTYCNEKLAALEEKYRKALTFTVYHRKTTLLVANLLFLLGIFLYTQVGTAFFTNDDQGTFQLECELPSGSSLDESYRIIKDVGEVVRENPAVDYTYSEIGNGTGAMKNEGTVYVQLKPGGERESLTKVMEDVRAKTSVFKDIDIVLTTFAGKDVEMTLVGSDTKKLADVAQKVIGDASKTGKIKDVKTDVRFDKPEMDIVLNRGLTDIMDVNIRTLNNELYAMFGDKKVGVFKENGYRYDIRMMASEEKRSGKNALDAVYIKNGKGDIIQGNNIFSYKETLGPSVIKRYDRQHSLSITANVTKDYSSGQAATLLQELSTKYIDEGSGIVMLASGMSKSQQDDFKRLSLSLLAAVFLVYIIMAVQFESFVHPFTIMFALPLLTPGTFGLLYLSNCKLDVMSYMGIILLVGIVVNNGIILVSFINQEREKGIDKVTAVINAGPLRLRAILITALSTLIGAVPAALMLTTGSESRQPMAIAIFGGLFTSTFLTLLVVPVVYLIMDDLIEKHTTSLKDFFARIMSKID